MHYRGLCIYLTASTLCRAQLISLLAIMYWALSICFCTRDVSLVGNKCYQEFALLDPLSIAANVLTFLSFTRCNSFPLFYVVSLHYCGFKVVNMCGLEHTYCEGLKANCNIILLWLNLL